MSAGPKSPDRLYSVDMVRGLVMILMTLDHTRNLFTDNTRFNFDIHDPEQTTPALFFTRWLSHFCAPAFIFIAGIGAALAEYRGMTKPRLTWFLVTRGLWLVFLEMTAVRMGFFFSFDWRFSLGSVIWVLGWSMVLLAGLQYLPRPLIAVFALFMIIGHNSLDGIDAEDCGAFAGAWGLLHGWKEIPLFGQYTLMTPYKLIPWVGVMALGYAIGPIFQLAVPERRRTLLALGIGATAAFVLVRWTNWYGDPKAWQLYNKPSRTIVSFLSCAKYPPSLCFLLMTLGPTLIALGVFDRAPGPIGRRIIVFGRVPLFFYLLHLPLIHGLAIYASYLHYREVVPWLISPPPWAASAPPGYGYSLPVVYVVSIFVLLILYLPCVWYAELKKRHPGGVLSYL